MKFLLMLVVLLGSVSVQAPVDWLKLLPTYLGPQLMTLISLITAQVLLAVAVSLKQGVFEWRRLPDFYRVMVLPLLLGWLALSILAKFAAPAALGAEYGYLVAEGIVWAAWLAVVGALVAKIIESVKTLYGELIPLKQ